MTKYCFIDSETFCDVDIGLGNDLYTRAAACMIVTFALSELTTDGRWLDQPTELWQPWQGPLIPHSLQRAIDDPEVIFVAHSAVFDRLILLRSLKIRIPLKRWRCTRAQAYSVGLPGSLELLGEVVGLPKDYQKLVEDKHLIDTFCCPQGTGARIYPYDRPEDWKRFCRYAIRDTDTLREIYKRLPTCNYTGINLRAWFLDQLINERGFEFDGDLARASVAFLADAKIFSEREVDKATHGEVHAATQRNRLLKYLQEKCGIDIESLRASEVRDWLEHDDLDPVVKVLLEQRLEASRNPGAKLARGLRMVGPRNRQRNTIQFNGAGRTGRHSGRGFQPQNMARPTMLIRRRLDGAVDYYNGIRGTVRSEHGGAGSNSGQDATLSSPQRQGGPSLYPVAFDLAPAEQQGISDSPPIQEQQALYANSASNGSVGVLAENGAGSRSQGSEPGQPTAGQSSVAVSFCKSKKAAPQYRLELSPVKATYIDEVILPGIRDKRALNNDLVYGGPYEAVSLAVRHVITAAAGNELVVGDFKNVESVITAWISGETAELQAFADAFENPKDKALDPYRKQWVAFFGGNILDVNDTERQGGKVSKLAFGFGGGVGALVTMAAGYQMDLEPLADIILPRATEEQKAKAYKAWRRAFLTANDFELEPRVYQACDVLKQVYRTTNVNIDQTRKDLDKAIKSAIKEPMACVYNVARCKIWSTGSCLNIELPSGRRLLYWFPKIQEEVIADPDGGKPWTSEYVTYCTARGKQWRRERAWAGLFFENIVQAIANCILRAAMVRVHNDCMTVPEIVAYLNTLPEEERTAIVLSVHDEVALDVPVGSYPVERLMRMLIQKEKWMDGLPMAADLWKNYRYGKR